jgi:hypothetical protein
MKAAAPPRSARSHGAGDDDIRVEGGLVHYWDTSYGGGGWTYLCTEAEWKRRREAAAAQPASRAERGRT